MLCRRGHFRKEFQRSRSDDARLRISPRRCGPAHPGEPRGRSALDARSLPGVADRSPLPVGLLDSARLRHLFPPDPYTRLGRRDGPGLCARSDRRCHRSGLSGGNAFDHRVARPQLRHRRRRRDDDPLTARACHPQRVIGSILALPAIEFQPVAHKIVSEFGGNFGLQLLDLVGAEFDHRTRFYVDQVIVMRRVRRLEAGRRILESMPLHYPLLLQRRKRPVDRRERDGRVDFLGPPVQLAGIRMVLCLGQDLQDCGALTGDAHAAIPQNSFQFLDPILALLHPATLAKGVPLENSQLQMLLICIDLCRPFTYPYYGSQRGEPNDSINEAHDRSGSSGNGCLFHHAGGGPGSGKTQGSHHLHGHRRYGAERRGRRRSGRIDHQARRRDP
ncbi:hypothetical protein EMEDMD4_370019 [Sinorhizobium medicae]|uniref:Uncharacterized protein n=1 Tax=Sinorhizobium medicae TaxID=110321 RepID=A0A508WXT7_9HYPH|nr:hypothetical protein EMEDMD4_370019 [Sinorhizobium medicae]